MQIGRITGLPEPQSVDQDGMSDVSFDLLVTEVQARQLLDLADNTAERFVPITSTSMPELDGLYELGGVSAGMDANLKVPGRRQVSVSARAVNRGRQVANAVLAVRGDNRWVNNWNGTSYPLTASDIWGVRGGCTGPLYRVAIPDPATSIQSFNAGAAGYTVASSALSTMRGSVRRLTDATQVKEKVLVATTANINLSTGGTITVDGVSVATNGTRVLVKNQTTASQNGIYTKQTGAWTRAADADGGTELDFAQVGVEIGTANGGSSWFLPQVVTIGTTSQTWRRAPQAGLRESDRRGPVVLSYLVGLSDWYNGACTVTQGSNVVTGLRLASTGTITIDNGLLQLTYGNRTISSVICSGFLFKVATGSPLAWGLEYFLMVGKGEGSALDLDSPSIITNTAEQVVLRSRFSGGSVDIAMRRGSRTLTFAFNVAPSVGVTTGATVYAYNATSSLVLPASNYLNVPTTGFVDTTATMSAAGTGTEIFDYASSNDSDGNRLAVTALVPWDTAAVISNSPIALHAIIGGGTTYTGNDQLYGLAREWFGAIATQTSAGVL